MSQIPVRSGKLQLNQITKRTRPADWVVAVAAIPAAIRARFWDKNEPTWENVARALNLTQEQARYRVTKALEFLKKKIGQNDKNA